jgi:uncharacterized membrane protein YgdD (TMEM256/DUF423 family)
MAALGCLFGALWVGLSAVQAHALQHQDSLARGRLDWALKLLIVHAIALVLVHVQSQLGKARPGLVWVGMGFGLGTSIFCGSLIALAFGAPAGLSTAAPVGGMLLILSWVLYGALNLGAGNR